MTVTYKCSECGDTFHEYIDALRHYKDKHWETWLGKRAARELARRENWHDARRNPLSNKKKLTRQQVINQAEKLRRIAMDALRSASLEQKTSERLAKFLMALAAGVGGTLEIPVRMIDAIPPDGQLIEMYDDNTDTIILRAARPKPLIETPTDEQVAAVQPEIMAAAAEPQL